VTELILISTRLILVGQKALQVLIFLFYFYNGKIQMEKSKEAEKDIGRPFHFTTAGRPTVLNNQKRSTDRF
jgi:hypothetical protein